MDKLAIGKQGRQTTMLLQTKQRKLERPTNDTGDRTSPKKIPFGLKFKYQRNSKLEKALARLRKWLLNSKDDASCYG